MKTAFKSAGASAHTLRGELEKTGTAAKTMTKAQEAQARALRASGRSYREIAKDMGVADSAVRRLISDGKKQSKALGQMGTSSRKAAHDTRNLGSSLKTAAKAAAGAVIAYAGISQAKEAISVTEELAKATISLHENLGLSVKEASEWAAVATTRGADTAKLTMAFKTLSNQIVAARDGTETAVEMFKKLGFTEDDIARGTHNFHGLLLKTAAGLQHLGVGADKASISGKLFGKGYASIQPILRDGAKALQENLDLANQYGATFGGRSLKSVQDLIGAQRELKFAQLGVQIAFTEKVAPALIKVGLKFAHFVKQMRTGKGAGGEFARTMEDIGAVLKVVGNVIGWIADHKGPSLIEISEAINQKLRAAAHSISTAFTSAKSAVVDAVNTILRAYNAVPVLGDVGLIGGGGGGGKAPAGPRGPTTSAPAGPRGPAGRARGGAVDRPMFIVGEEAPAHPEWVIATNPAYKRDNLRYWAQAGKDLGVPGFKKGGLREPQLSGTSDAFQPLIHRSFLAVMQAIAKAGGDRTFAAIVKNANRMDGLHQPYVWGGGHGATASRNGPWDCSGAISELFNGAGWSFAPMVSGGFGSWGLPGKGKVSVLSNAEHVYAVIGNRAFGTSEENPGGGAGWIDGYTYRGGFATTHADLANPGAFLSRKRGKGQHQRKGFARGGRMDFLGGPTINPTQENPGASRILNSYPRFAKWASRHDYSNRLGTGAWYKLLRAYALNQGVDPGEMTDRHGWGLPGSWRSKWSRGLMYRMGGLLGFAKGGRLPGWVHGSSTLNADQLASLAAYVGAANPALMGQYAMGESSGVPTKVGGEGERGLWQILGSTAANYGLNWGKMFDPLYNARSMAVVLAHEGVGAWHASPTGPKGKVTSLRGAGGAGGGGGSRKFTPKIGISKARSAGGVSRHKALTVGPLAASALLPSAAGLPASVQAALSAPGLSYEGQVGLAEQAAEFAAATEGGADDQAARAFQRELFGGRKAQLQKQLARLNAKLSKGGMTAQSRAKHLAKRETVAGELRDIEGGLLGLDTAEKDSAGEKQREIDEAMLQATQELAATQKELAKELKETRELSESAIATGGAVAWRALADKLSGNLGARVIAGARGGIGSVART
jgi:hypothetical protein